MDRLKFYVEDHIYELDGVKIPSVHEILNGGKPSGSSEAMRLGAQRGQELHKASELFLSSREGEISFTDATYSFDWETLKNGLIDIQKDFQIVAVEVRSFYEKGNIKYAGTLDIKAMTPEGKFVNIDIKTGKKITKNDCIQQAPYETINGCDYSLILHLKEFHCELIKVEDLQPKYRELWEDKVNAYFGYMTIGDHISGLTENLEVIDNRLLEEDVKLKDLQNKIKELKIEKESVIEQIKNKLDGKSAKTHNYSISYRKGSTRTVFNHKLIPENIKLKYQSFDEKRFKKEVEKEIIAEYSETKTSEPTYSFKKIEA